MKITPSDEFWVVTSPKYRDSVLEDILFKSSIWNLHIQFMGGLTMNDLPTIYTRRDLALEDAKDRLAKRDAGVAKRKTLGS